MIDRLAVWRQRAKLWVPALAFVLLNLGVLGVYRMFYAGKTELRARRIELRQVERRDLRKTNRELSVLVDRAKANAVRVELFYDDRVSTETETLTRVITEVKVLANRAEIEPSSIRYSKEDYEAYGLRRRTIVFSVAGSYLQLRRLINFLELSDTFITLEQVGLSQADEGGEVLRITLRLSALFDDRSVAEAS